MGLLDSIVPQLVSYGLKGDYYQTRHGVPNLLKITQEHLHQDINCAICLDGPGTQGMHTYQHNVELLFQMQTVAEHGIIFYPKFTSSEGLGSKTLTRFDPNDLNHAIIQAQLCVVMFHDLEKEFAISF